MSNAVPEISAPPADLCQAAEHRVVQHAQIAFVLVDGQGKIVFANPAFCSLSGYSASETPALGIVDFVKEDLLIRKDGSTVHVEVTRTPCGEDEVYELRDVSGPVRRERTLQLLLDLSDAMRDLHDSTEIMALATRALGQHLDVSYCALVTANPNGGAGLVECAWPGNPGFLGKYPAVRVLDRKTVVSHGDETTPASMACPVIFRGHAVACMDLRYDGTREWTSDEVDLVERVTRRCWAEVQRVRADDERREAYEATLEGWSRTLDARDHETIGHSRRVAGLAVRLATRLNYPEERMDDLQRGALLHDIGKIGVPEDVLHKSGPLSDSERDAIKRHPEIAMEILDSIRFLQPALEIPYVHHERWDGTGYPRGLRGEEIPLSARIFAVVDVYDALTSDRPYRPAWPAATALAYIDSQAGRHFDPDVAAAFVEMKLEELEHQATLEH